MAGSSVVMEYFESLGILDGKAIAVSGLNALTVTLVSLGASTIIIPVPGGIERQRVNDAIIALPKERRRLVKTVDHQGTTLQRVREYFAPIAEQVSKWPETAFVDFATEALYKLTLASKANAFVIDADLANIHSFLSMVNPTQFSGEARFRLAELSHLFTLYEPALMESLVLDTHFATPEVRSILTDILDSVEFQEVVASRGSLGYLEHPRSGLRRVKKAVASVIARNRFRQAVRGSLTISGLAPPPFNLSGLRDLIPSEDRSKAFSPPSLDLPTATHYDICRVALSEFDPRAISTPRTLFAEQHLIEDKPSIAWVNEGEQKRLEYDPKQVLAYNQKELRNARRKTRGLLSYRRAAAKGRELL